MTTRDHDAGTTLVELILYMMVAALFLGLLAALFANGVRVQAQSTERDLATGRAGVIGDSILGSIRNSSGFVIVSQNRALITRTTTGDGSTVCRAWLVLRDGDAEYRRTSTDPVFTSGDIIYKQSASTISLSDTMGWSALVDRGGAESDGVRGALHRSDGVNADGTPRFTAVDADGDGMTDAFSRDGSTLSVGLAVTLGDTTVQVANGVTMQATAEAGAVSCW